MKPHVPITQLQQSATHVQTCSFYTFTNSDPSPGAGLKQIQDSAAFFIFPEHQNPLGCWFKHRLLDPGRGF